MKANQKYLAHDVFFLFNYLFFQTSQENISHIFDIKFYHYFKLSFSKSKELLNIIFKFILIGS